MGLEVPKEEDNPKKRDRDEPREPRTQDELKVLGKLEETETRIYKLYRDY